MRAASNSRKEEKTITGMRNWPPSSSHVPEQGLKIILTKRRRGLKRRFSGTSFYYSFVLYAFSGCPKKWVSLHTTKETSERNLPTRALFIVPQSRLFTPKICPLWHFWHAHSVASIQGHRLKKGDPTESAGWWGRENIIKSNGEKRFSLFSSRQVCKLNHQVVVIMALNKSILSGKI